MSIAVSADARIRDIEVTDDSITAHLVDGRVVSIPLAWLWRLSDATPAQRRRFQIIGDGHGVHWPDLDEDLSADGMLYGVPATRPPAGRAKTAATRQRKTPSPPRKGRRKAALTTTRQS